MRHIVSRVLWLALASLLLSACNPVFKTTGEGLLRVTGWGQPDLESAASDPRAGYLRLSGSAEALLVLGFREHGAEIWYGAGGVTFTLRNGVVFRATGLPGGSYLSHWSDEAYAALNTGWHTLPAGHTLPLVKTRHLRQGKAARVVRHSYRLIRDDLVPVRIWGGQVMTLLQVREVPDAGTQWPGNRYWLNPETGAVVASEQWFSPTQRYLLTPREPFERLPAAAALGERRQVVTQPQRLSALLRDDAGNLLRPLEQVAWIASADFPAVARTVQDLDYQLRDLAFARPAQTAAVAGLRERLRAVSPVARRAVPENDVFALLANPVSDPMLAAGDVLWFRQTMPAVRLVNGEGVTCEQTFVPGKLPAGYVRDCQWPLPAYLVLVHGHGSSYRINLAAWLPGSDREPTPGSVMQLPVAGWDMPTEAQVREQRDPLSRLAVFWWQQMTIPEQAAVSGQAVQP